MPARKTARPSREEGRLVLRLLRDLVPVDRWLGPERAAVTAFHRWAHGAPPNLDAPNLDRLADPAPIRAGDRPTPLPSEVLESVDGGRGIAGWILTPEALDHLPVLSRDPGDGNGDRVDGVPLPLGGGDSSPNPDDWTRPSDGYLDDAETWTPDGDYVPPPEVLALMRLDRLLGNERALSEVGTGRARGLVLGALRDVRRRTHPPAELHVAGPGTVTFDGHRLQVTYDPVEAIEDPRTEEAIRREERANPHPVEDDPRRPSLDHYPEDAILLTYREVRRVIAVHLESCANPLVARAMREGETPLRLAEVLDR